MERTVLTSKIKNLLPTSRDWATSMPPILRGSLLGFFLGVLPGAGPVIASFASYAMEKRLSKEPQKFETGMIQGVAGPEAANNAATGGGFVPLLTLGIPPNDTMALLLGALVIFGVQPGPKLIEDHPQLFWGVIASSDSPGQWEMGGCSSSSSAPFLPLYWSSPFCFYCCLCFVRAGAEGRRNNSDPQGTGSKPWSAGWTAELQKRGSERLAGQACKMDARAMTPD